MSISSVRRKGSAPVQSGTIRRSKSARVTGQIFTPKASPHPTSPVSVVTLISKLSIFVRGRPPKGSGAAPLSYGRATVSYTHLRAHETDSYLVCRLLLEN